jgi:uncharacterized protein YndB with AHSA1/START domain
MEYNWSSFTKRVNIKSSIADVYAMCSTPTGFEKWFLRVAEFRNKEGRILNENDTIQTEQTFRWLWHGWDDTTEEKGKVLEANGKDIVKFTFGQEGAPDMVCTFKMYEEENETILEIIQDNIPTDERGRTNYHIGCMMGWSFFMVNMKSVLENGYDLRNKNVHLKKVITA